MSLRQRAEEAIQRVKTPALPPGPWEIEREEVCIECSDEEQALAFPMTIGPVVEWTPDSDDPAQAEAIAGFISTARTDVPDFAAAILRLTAPEMRERIRAKLIDTVEPAANSAAFVVFGAGPEVGGRFADAIMGLLLAEVA